MEEEGPNGVGIGRKGRRETQEGLNNTNYPLNRNIEIFGNIEMQMLPKI